MDPPHLPPSSLPAFAHLTSIHLNGIEAAPVPSAGTGLLHRPPYDPSLPLLTIDPSLILCASTVSSSSKSSPHLSEVLHAVGDFSLTPRGAIMISLLLNLSTAAGLNTGPRSVWSEYTKFLPPHISLPTTWTPTERTLLLGTSLHIAVQAKLTSLSNEFLHLRTCTSSIPWCHTAWWSKNTLTLETWTHLDAVFRSRVLQFPRIGVGMAPVLDFANHSGVPSAYYSVDGEGAVVLVGREVRVGEEVTINYGSEKSAAELVFSYGFIPAAATSALWMGLDIKCPGDDPLALAKEAVYESAPVVRIVDLGGEVAWTGDFVWLMCVNEEDGLELRVEERGVVVFWCGEEVEGVGGLERRLRGGSMWEVYQLRALALVEERVEVQLAEVVEGEEWSREVGEDGEVSEVVGRLRGLERALLEKALGAFEEQKERLLETEVVRAYLKRFEEEEEGLR